MSAGNLQIGIDPKRGVIVFQYTLEGNLHTLEASPEQARALARGFMRCADRLEPQRKCYAVATERVIMKDGVAQWVPGGVEYLHAEDGHQARLAFERARDPRVQIRVVAIAPVIGYETSEGILTEKDIRGN